MTPFFWFRWIRRIVSVVLVLVVGAGVVLCGMVWWAGRGDDRRHSDTLLVMGASQYNGRPSAVFEARLEHARQLWAAGVAPVVVTVGGGQPGDRTTEGASGAAWLQEHGLPASATVAVPEGRDSLQSLRAAAVVYRERGWTTAVLVTDPEHSLRSRTMARDQGISAVTSPTREGPANSGFWTRLRYTAREAAAYAFYELFHRDAPKGPNAV